MDKEVALKMIPKKKVKGNEASVWSEMEVLKGLDHPNIVRPSLLFPALPAMSSPIVNRLPFSRRSSSMNGLNLDQSTICHSNWLLAGSCSKGY